MCKIKIKNFGPIRQGMKAEQWIEIKKVTLFIGNQGSGKSTIAKLISTFMWLEKALIRGDIKLPIDFLELIKFHRIEDYLEDRTEIEYIGNNYSFKLIGTSKTQKTIERKKLNNKIIKLPKIMYVPAERNFLSSIENINKVSNLIVGSLRDYSIEFRNAQLTNKGKSIYLPINKTKVVYDDKDDENYLEFKSKRLKLSHASSGFHSIVPLYWVTKYLIEFIKQDEKKLLELLSPDQTVRRDHELKALNTLNLDEKQMHYQKKEINNKYICNYLVNIVEEPEQNLFPTSQRLLLHSLLQFNKYKNRLIMTTHSPYMLVYITLCVEAHKLKQKVNTKELKSRLSKVVPLESTIDGLDLAIYQLNEIDGSIEKLKDYRGLPSDENKLNDGLAEANELFSKLLEIEDLCQ